MTRLFRSKSCSLGRAADSMFHPSPPSPSIYLTNGEEEDEEEEDEAEEPDEGDDYFADNPVTTPFIGPEHRRQQQQHHRRGDNQFPMLAILAAALRKSLVTCSVETEDVSSIDIGWPTDVRHVSHVTFDRFDGFLGLPVELQPDVPRKVPSASASVFGVSAKSMHCYYDQRGNSVPTILLLLQQQLYSGGGLKAEGIFRINAENSQEEHVRSQLNRGVVPHGIDVHCLAGLIKAWFRELPTGVLDSLTPEQVMRCHTEDECTQLVQLLPSTEVALLDWAINLMADVVQHEHHNKMNARNIAMVFAPNMTQMADPLTALMHAVQVMNFLKTLIMKTLRERGESMATVWLSSSCADTPRSKGDPASLNHDRVVLCDQSLDGCVCERPAIVNPLRNFNSDRLECDTEEKFWCFQSKTDAGEEYVSVSGRSSPVTEESGENEEVEGILNRLSLRKGVRKLCTHPVFQLTKPVKKAGELAIVNSREGGQEAWT